jgi:hypothetical protein
MKPERAPEEAVRQLGASPLTPIPCRWLPPVRVLWVAMAILAVGLLFVSLPITYMEWHALCTGDDCYFWQLTPKDITALQKLGLSADFYAGYSVALEVSYAIGFSTIGARRPQDPRGHRRQGARRGGPEEALRGVGECSR